MPAYFCEKKIEFLHFLMNFEEMYQKRPNNVLKWRLHGDTWCQRTYFILNIYYKTHYRCIFFDFTSPNASHEVIKNLLFCILIVLEKYPTDVPKTSREVFRRWTSLSHPQHVNFELYKCISVLLFSILFDQICVWYTNCCILLYFWWNAPRGINVPIWCLEGDVLTTSPKRQLWANLQNIIFVVIFSILTHQPCVLNTKKLVIANSFSFGGRF